MEKNYTSLRDFLQKNIKYDLPKNNALVWKNYITGESGIIFIEGDKKCLLK